MRLVLPQSCHKETALQLNLVLLMTQQEAGARHTHEATMVDNRPSSHQEEQLAAPETDVAVADPETSTDLSTKEQEETGAEKRETIKEEQQETEGGGGGEEGKGVKRKREETHMEDESRPSTEKKKVTMNEH